MNAPSRYRSVFSPGLFAGQVIVVTGGGSGIGRCTAHELASLGAQVVLVGRKAEKLQQVQAEIATAGGKAGIQAFDIRQEEAVRDAVAAIVAAHGRIDGLVNNAGGQYITPLAAISAKGWEAVIHTNLTGGFLVARECFVQSMQAQGGAIVNIVADIWGSMPNMGHSGAARAGMVSFTETAALEWAAKRRARERRGAGLHRLERHGPLPARGRRHAARHAQHRARGALRQRGRDLRRHRLPAEPRGELHQRQRAARGWRTAAGAHGLADGIARCTSAAARGGAALRRLSSRADATRFPEEQRTERLID
jgi:NADP-dependent 3-hydroxy acid dehydrogenase YdfG